MKLAKIVGALAVLLFLGVLGYGLTTWFLGAGDKPQQPNALDQALADLSAGSAPPADSQYQVGDRLANQAPAASFDPAYPELDWDSLMPSDWDPMAPFRNLNLAELKDNDPRAQEALTQMREMWNNAPVNPEVSDRKIRMPGFVIPIEQSEAGVTELLLVPYFGACIHTPPPPANQIVHVKFDEPVPGIGAMQPFWVWGDMSVNRFSSEYGDAAYLLQAQGIRNYDF